MNKTRAEPRGAAFETLKQTRQGIPIDTAMSGAVHELSSRDRRLAHEIAAGVLRHRTIIDKQIQQLLTRPNKPLPSNIQDILRIGVYQLIYLDKVPSYAAVSSAVDLARGEGGKKAGGLVNAVLRKLDRTGPSVDLTNCSMADRHSHPEWLVNRWLKHFGAERTEQLLTFCNKKPSLVVQSARWDEGMLVSTFREAGVQLETTRAHHGIVVESSDVTSLPGYQEGAFIVQDPAQRALLDFAAVPDASLIWDPCAAPGGKAVTMADRHTVVATEISKDRMRTLRENRDRVAPTMPIAVANAKCVPFREQTFDAVLLDAPCSGTGAMGRHPDARWSLTEKKIRRAATLQREILDATAATVKPGGLLVYLTCSLEPEENEHQIDDFLAVHNEFERTREDLSIFPPDHGTDGGFGARMRRIR